MYNSFNGTPADNIHVDFINEASGEVIDKLKPGEPLNKPGKIVNCLQIIGIINIVVPIDI